MKRILTLATLLLCLTFAKAADPVGVVHVRFLNLTSNAFTAYYTMACDGLPECVTTNFNIAPGLDCGTNVTSACLVTTEFDVQVFEPGGWAFVFGPSWNTQGYGNNTFDFGEWYYDIWLVYATQESEGCELDCKYEPCTWVCPLVTQESFYQSP